MALVSIGFFLTVNVKDTGGNDTTRTFQMVAADAAAAVTDAAAILTAFGNVSDAGVVGYSIAERFVEQSFTLPAAAEVENQALVTMGIFQKPNKSGSVSIPAPKPGIMVNTSGQGFNQPDFTDVALIAYLNLFTTGGKAKLSDGEVAVLTNAKGKRVHSRSVRG